MDHREWSNDALRVRGASRPRPGTSYTDRRGVGLKHLVFDPCICAHGSTISGWGEPM